MKTFASTSLILFFFMLSPSVIFAEIYKCSTQNGETIFQDRRCADQDKQELIEFEEGPTEQQIMQSYDRHDQVLSHLDEMQRNYYRHEDSIIEYYDDEYGYYDESVGNNSPCTPGQVPLNSSRLNPNRGWSDRKGYVELECGSPDGYDNDTSPSIAPRIGPGYTEPEKINDQFGNHYTRPPGSNMALDPKTGRQCLVVGNTIQCPD